MYIHLFPRPIIFRCIFFILNFRSFARREKMGLIKQKRIVSYIFFFVCLIKSFSIGFICKFWELIQNNWCECWLWRRTIYYTRLFTLNSIFEAVSQCAFQNPSNCRSLAYFLFSLFSVLFSDVTVKTIFLLNKINLRNDL